MEAKSRIPTITLVGAGGCGINLMNKILSHGITEGEETSARVTSAHAIDTCRSNMHDLHSIIKEHLLAEDGSGKNRGTHLENIQQKLMSENIAVSEVTIIVTSLSGGSGSVIGPLIARAHKLEGSRVVVVGVVDDTSKADCLNSIKSLRTLDAYAKEEQLYFPIMLFSNIGVGRFAVNKTVETRVSTLIEMLTSPTVTEMDLKDKLNFLSPDQVGHAPSGIYALGVTNSNGEITGAEAVNLAGEPPLELGANTPAHASITIDANGMAVHKFSNTTFIGYSEVDTFYAIIGRPLDRQILADLKKMADQHGRTAPIQESNMDEMFNGTEDVKTSAII